MAATFQVLSLLLSYPSAEIAAAAPELKRAIESERLVPARLCRDLGTLIDDLAAGDLFDLQERYGMLFDRTRSLSLYLFEHIHGENRDRGQAMVDLMALYGEHGLQIEARELPDYLPMFLEFLSALPADQACALLGEPLDVLSALKARHRKRNSAYEIVFTVLEALAKGEARPEAVAALLAAPDDDPDDLEALDRIWEEEVVTFGANAAGSVAPGGACPATRDLLARMDPPSGSEQPTVARETD